MTLHRLSPADSPIRNFLAHLHRELSGLTEGEVATYIPELAKANPEAFGICVVTANGGIYESGDSRLPFTIQSISKPFVYGLALEDHGREEVRQKVGVEPTGDAFNSISLDKATGRPRNPMINAGAIASTGLIEGKTTAVKFRRMLEMFKRYTGRELTIDKEVYSSESSTGHRNRAIGYMLRNFDILTDDPTPTVETYFQQCSILVHCVDLATIAATLANRGVNPVTGEQAVRGEYVESILGVMGTCGMYDYAGEWLYEVGLPAKSGVSGGIIAVLPGQLGIGVYSPRLDSHGNSVRGIKACSALSRHWDLHLYNRAGIGKTSLRQRLNASVFSSTRVRAPREAEVLRQHGQEIRIYQLQGHLIFTTMETVIREIFENEEVIETLIFDFRHILSINEPACHLFHDLVCKLAAVGCRVVFCQVEQHSPLRRVMRGKLGPRHDELFHVMDELDLALQAAEDRLLERRLPSADETSIPAGDYDLFSGLNADELGIVRQFLERRSYQAGENIFKSGDPARELYLLARGSVSAFLANENGGKKRLAVFTDGMTFGEMAMLDRSPHTATATADTPTECDVLSHARFVEIGHAHPKIKNHVLENICLGLCAQLRKANREISSLV